MRCVGGEEVYGVENLQRGYGCGFRCNALTNCKGRALYQKELVEGK